MKGQRIDKLKFAEVSQGFEQHCHSEPVRTLAWESPSNFGQLIVIQTVLFCAVSRNLPVCYREMVLLSGRLPHQESGLVRNDRVFDKFQFIDLL